MRKILFIFLGLVFMVSYVYGGQINKQNTFIPGAIISSADVNENFDDIYDEFNGEIEGGSGNNIKADSLTELDMADDINPRIRWDEILQDFVYSGLQPATSVNLISNISAGVAYVDGYRVNKASATSKTYGDDVDTYVEISYLGAFKYTEKDLGADAPSTSANHTMLAAVSTDDNNITHVTDLRTLSHFTNTLGRHMISNGFELGYGSSGTTIVVNAGVLAHETTEVRKTADTTLTLATAGDWLDESAYSYAGGQDWVYVYSDNAGNIKLEETAPTLADTSGNTAGNLMYHLETATYWRVIGAAYVSNTNKLAWPWTQVGNEVIYWVDCEGSDPTGDSTVILDEGNTTSWTDVTVTFLPSLSNPIPLLFGQHTGDSGSVSIRTNGDSLTYGVEFYNYTAYQTLPCIYMPVDSNKKIEYKSKNGQAKLSLWARGFKWNR